MDRAWSIAGRSAVLRTAQEVRDKDDRRSGVDARVGSRWGERRQLSSLPPDWRGICAALGTTAGDPTVGDLDGLTELNAMGLDIEARAGLKHAVNPRRLDFTDNQVSDLSPLFRLSARAELSIRWNPCAIFFPFSGLSELSELVASFHEIEGFSPLKGLTSLFRLGFSQNRAQKLAPLALLLLFSEVLNLAPSLRLAEWGPNP